MTYQFGPFITEHNEYTREAHEDLRDQAREAGWVPVPADFFQVKKISRQSGIPLYNWCVENKVKPLNIGYYGEFWFETEEEALLFKLTWL